jgi:hypothetical protein
MYIRRGAIGISVCICVTECRFIRCVIQRPPFWHLIPFPLSVTTFFVLSLWKCRSLSKLPLLSSSLLLKETYVSLFIPPLKFEIRSTMSTRYKIFAWKYFHYIPFPCSSIGYFARTDHL